VGLAAATAVFVAVGTWIGKIGSTNASGDATLLPQIDNVYYYGTCGFAYFNHVIEVEKDIDYFPSRTFYPLFRILSSAGVAREPPSQINEFYTIPFATNVGTVLEPFYRDGGLGFTFVGILLVSFVFDALALWFWRQGHFLADFAAANLCFATFLGFFTPKVASFPLWLFCGLGAAPSLAARLFAHQPDLRRAS
jgi:oligosaccharide repeat unit polymerase